MLALGLGSTIASAASITPTHDVHHLSGSTAVTTIVPPNPTFCGVVIFITDSTAAFSNNGGNITMNAGGGIGNAYMFVYDSVGEMWSPVI